jgi:hypothetical protein
MKLQNFKALLEAYTLGNTSPKRRIRKVTKITSIENLTKLDGRVKSTIFNAKFLSFKNTSPNEAKIKTMRIFIKLFVIRIVANSLLGFCKSLTMGLSCFDFSDILTISVGDNEKKATSVPDIKAEQKSNKKRIEIAIKDVLSTLAK